LLHVIDHDLVAVVVRRGLAAGVSTCPQKRRGIDDRRIQLPGGDPGRTAGRVEQQAADIPERRRQRNSTNAGVSVNLTQSLYNNENYGNINVAEAKSAAELSLLKSARQGLILRVSEAYFRILAAKDNVEFTYAERTAIARQLEEAQKRFEVGLIAITDVYEAQASFDNSEAQVILAENILENAFQSLVVLTADSSIKTLTPLGENLKLSLPNPASVE
jgi:outer membrane protein